MSSALRAAILALAASALFAISLVLPAGVSAQHRKPVLAVAHFDDLSDTQALAPLGQGLAAMLTTDLSLSSQVTVVERARLSEVISELQFQQSPWVERSSAAELGKLLGADYLVVGSFAVAADVLRIDSKVVDVETSAVVAAASQTGPLDSVFTLEGRLAVTLLEELGAALSPIAGKRAGTGGTDDLQALLAWSEALQALDAGDSPGAAALLRAALEHDPQFLRAAAALGELTDRVEALERSGGLILAPTTAGDHLVNFRLLLERGDYDGAQAELLRALDLDPDRAEAWARLRRLPKAKRPAFGDKGIDWPSGSRGEVLSAFLEGDRPRLALLAESKADEAWLHVLRLVLAEERAGAPSWTDVRVAASALKFLERSESADVAASVLVDREKLADRRKDWFGRAQLEPGMVEWVEARVARIEDPLSRDDFGYGAWVLLLLLPESPHGAVEVAFEPDVSHPFWTRAPSSRLASMHPAGSSGLPYDEYRRRVLESGPSDFAFSVSSAGEAHRFRTARYGEAFSVPLKAWTSCESVPGFGTGLVCSVRIEIDKSTTPAGPWKVTIRYLDPDGVLVKLGLDRIWAPEFKLEESWLDHDAGWPQLVHEITPELRARFGWPQSARWQARVCGQRPSGDGVVDEPTIHYDWDFRLLGGATPREDDTSTWISYQDKIIQAGVRRVGTCSDLYVPDLGPGQHSLCFVATYPNGDVSAEPFCLGLELP